MDESVKPAVILLAHGSRDPRWGEPFQRIADRLRAVAPDLVVEMAYLEHLSPDLAESARRLAALGARRIRVVPLFFGRGGHLREDVPRQLAAVGKALPGVALELALPAGEDDAVIDALAAFCVRAVRGTQSPGA
jgi:sirohydrochlorin cobaltochelatase